mmetsp:Transcript_36599/g.84900  ORF Transcript_36599/g.84900 Transcript_36599/m.84900 type:complete len:232 (-) Transcript_36599:1498-2193(-)
MCSATGVLPTKLTAAMPGWARMASTMSLSPWTTLNTPSGRPASFSHCAISSAADGSRSLGFKIKALPQPMAIGYIHIGTMAGKLNGVMPATTPSGWRMLQASMPRAICSVYSPLSSCGMPVANSTTSMPRATSPSASGTVLPCSRTMASASCSLRSCSRVRNLNSTRARASGGVWLQDLAACVALATAASRSAVLPRRSVPCTAPVAGLWMSCWRSPVPRVTAPLIQWPTS